MSNHYKLIDEQSLVSLVVSLLTGRANAKDAVEIIDAIPDFPLEQIDRDYKAMAKKVCDNNENMVYIINKLHQWSSESIAGGWSTHQVESQRELADRLIRILARTLT